MYEELVKRLRNCTSDTVEDCAGCPYQGGYKGTYCMNGLVAEAADAIEELIAYVRQIEELRKDGYYLQKTKMMTYGQAIMTMPLPEPPKEET